MGNHLTTHAPPVPSLSLISAGRCASLAIIGYPISMPNEDNLVLSAYKTKHKGVLFSGKLF